MSIVASLFSGLAFGAVDAPNKTDVTDKTSEKKENDIKEQIQIARKGELLDQFEAAVVQGDMDTAIKIKTELAKLSDVPISSKRTKEYTKLLKSMSEMKANLLDQKEAAISKGEDPPRGIDKKFAVLDTLSSMFQEVLKRPKVGAALPEARQEEYEKNLKGLSQRKAEIYDQILASLLKGESRPKGLFEQIAKINTLAGFYNDALGKPKSVVKLPEGVKKEYRSTLEKAKKFYDEKRKEVESAQSIRKEVPGELRVKLATTSALIGLLQEMLVEK